ncbi:MAG: glycosyltransferase family 9 protein [Bacteroidota bacterium]
MKVLIIQQKMIGDVLATSILFEAIKKKYPKAELHYVLNSHTYPVVEGNPFIDQFHFFTTKHEKSRRKLWQFAHKLRLEKFDVVIDVYAMLSSNIMTLRSKAKTKISIDKGHNTLIYNHTFKNKSKAKTNAGLAIENRLQLLEPLDIDTNKIVRPKIYLSEAERNRAKEFLESHTIDLKKPILMIGVLGSEESKTYPFAYMAEVIDTIVKLQPESQILFNYIPKQEAEAKAIFELCQPETKAHIFFDVFGRNLRDFLAITAHCRALIGNEGGAINMAKALHIPTFTIFSPWIKKEAWNMFDDDIKHISVHLSDFDNAQYETIDHPKVLRPKAFELYETFNPSLFEKQLKTFLERLH